MKKTKTILLFLLIAAPFLNYAQGEKENALPKPKLIAVVNRANWCAVCKQHGARAGSLLTPYMAEGVGIFMNDLTDEITRASSKQALQKQGVYEAVAKIKQTGTIAFVSPNTHKLLKQISIAQPDAEIKAVIDELIKQAK